MTKPLIKIYLVTSALFFTTALIAQTQQAVPDPPKGDGSHTKDTSYSITGASKNEVRGAYGQGSVNETDTMPPSRKRKTRFTYTAPNNTNGTNGSNIAPGR